VEIASLGSGSRGNATLLASPRTKLLIDCGFSLREIERRAAARAIDLSALEALLLTHEHSDHAAGAAALARRHGLPVYLSHGTARATGLDVAGGLDLRCFDAGSSFRIGDLQVLAVPVPHDAREPVQYRFDCAGIRVGVLTDLGSVTAHLQGVFADCDLLMLEFNHDRDMLRAGPYPPALKRRVGGDWGHLSNGQALELLDGVDRQRLRHLVVAHVSEKNNCRERVLAALSQRFPELLPGLCFADQVRGFDWLSARSLAAPPARAAY